MSLSTARRLVLAAAAGLCIAATPPTSDPLDIYVVRGPANQLEAFKAKLKDWKGGEFLRHLSSNSEHRYWAYSTRTASEARIFIFGSFEHGLRLDIEEFDEAAYFPKERALLDGFVSKCGASDPFHIQPNRTLLIEANAGPDSGRLDCVLREFRRANFESVMPVSLVATEVRGDPH